MIDVPRSWTSGTCCRSLLTLRVTLTRTWCWRARGGCPTGRSWRTPSHRSAQRTAWACKTSGPCFSQIMSMQDIRALFLADHEHARQQGLVSRRSGACKTAGPCFSQIMSMQDSRALFLADHEHATHQGLVSRNILSLFVCLFVWV